MNARKITLLLTLALPMMVGGCMTGDLGEVAASAPAPRPTVPSGDDAQRLYTEDWGRRFEADPDDKVAALNYAQGLRALREYPQAVAVLQRAAVKHLADLDVLGAYGKALADDGRLNEAAAVLARAHTPDNPNWSILSAQGVVADEMGDHTAAQGYYHAALKIVPREPTVLSNLGLSYALSKQLNLADQTMRQAVASPRADARVRQNYALVLALEGKFSDAEKVGKTDLSPADAAADVAQIRQMIGQSKGSRYSQKTGHPKTYRAIASAVQGG